MRRFAGVAGLVLAVVLTGCSGEKPGTFRAPSKAPVQNATGFLTTASFVPTMKQAATGKTTVKTSTSMTGGGVDLTMTGDLQLAEPVGMSLDLDGPAVGGKGKVIVLDSVFYVSMEELVAQGKYLKIDPAKTPNDPTTKALADAMSDLDPTKTFDSIEAGIQQIKHVGSETIDGQKTEKYRVTIDAARAMVDKGKALPPGTPETIEYDIWLTADNLMRRTSMALAGVSVLIDFTDWGKPVSIKAPAPADIVER